MLKSLTLNIEAILSICSLTLSIIALVHNNSNDKKKQAVKMIDDFDRAIIPSVNDMIKDTDYSEKLNDLYKSMKLVIKYYSRIDSGIVDRKLAQKYLYPDIVQIDKWIKPLADIAYKRVSYNNLKYTIKRYNRVVLRLKRKPW